MIERMMAVARQCDKISSSCSLTAIRPDTSMEASKLFQHRRTLDDFEDYVCNNRHQGPTLYIEGDFEVMRCSFCDQIIKKPMPAAKTEEKNRNSRTCIMDCNWVTEGKMVRCLSCSYTGPLP